MSKDFNAYAKPAYKCGICESVYDSIEERAACEAACLKKKAEAQRLAEEQKKKDEKIARKKEVDEAIKRAQDLLDQYAEDYGVYHCDDTIFCSSFPFETSFIDLLTRLP